MLEKPDPKLPFFNSLGELRSHTGGLAGVPGAHRPDLELSGAPLSTITGCVTEWTGRGYGSEMKSSQVVQRLVPNRASSLMLKWTRFFLQHALLPVMGVCEIIPGPLCSFF